MFVALSPSDKTYLLHNARESIRSRLEHDSPRFGPTPEGVRIQAGAFVTLRKKSQLRGCIGTMSSTRELVESVRELAQTSAFADPRFPPLKPEELADTTIEISVLSPLERVSSPDDVVVGRDGIQIVAPPRSGVLLPQVATEQGWDRETFLTHTCLKAGLPGDAWRSNQVEIYRFSAVVFSETERT